MRDIFLSLGMRLIECNRILTVFVSYVMPSLVYRLRSISIDVRFCNDFQQNSLARLFFWIVKWYWTEPCKPSSVTGVAISWNYHRGRTWCVNHIEMSALFILPHLRGLPCWWYFQTPPPDTRQIGSVITHLLFRLGIGHFRGRAGLEMFPLSVFGQPQKGRELLSVGLGRIGRSHACNFRSTALRGYISVRTSHSTSTSYGTVGTYIQGRAHGFIRPNRVLG